MIAKRADFAAAVRASFARQGAMQHIGARIERIEPGECEIAVDYRPELTQQNGFFHAGITSAIADSAGGYAAFSLFPEGADVLTVEYKINLIEPARGQTLVAVGRVVRAGRLCATRLDVFAIENGVRTLCAIGQQTVMRMDPRR